MSVNPGIRIRDYQKSDFSAVQSLWEETGMGGKERGDTPEIIEQCLVMGGKFLVMEDAKEDTIIGTSWMTFDGRRIFLHHFGIKPEYQGQGYGKQLAAASLKFIKRKGYQVKLEVHKENHKAKMLYEHAGFFAFTDYDIYMIRDTEGIRIDKLF